METDFVLLSALFYFNIQFNLSLSYDLLYMYSVSTEDMEMLHLTLFPAAKGI